MSAISIAGGRTGRLVNGSNVIAKPVLGGLHHIYDLAA
jgi:hypothetical protein